MQATERLVWSAVFMLALTLLAASVTVTTKKPLVEVHENEDAVLSCEFQTQADPHPRIEWKKRDKSGVHFIYFQGKFLDNLAQRATIKGATVTIHQVTQMDAGVYHCEVSASQDTVSLGETNVTLKVLVPPNTPHCEIPSSALTGMRVTLRCWDKQSIPPATYSWYKDNKLLSVSRVANTTYLLDPSAGTLVLNSVSHSDSGLYHCEASNGIGAPKSCKGGHVHIDDMNVSAIVVGVIVICLLLLLCTLAGCYAHRQGYLSQARRGSSNTSYTSSTKDTQDFKHTQSFVL